VVESSKRFKVTHPLQMRLKFRKMFLNVQHFWFQQALALTLAKELFHCCISICRRASRRFETPAGDE